MNICRAQCQGHEDVGAWGLTIGGQEQAGQVCKGLGCRLYTAGEGSGTRGKGSRLESLAKGFRAAAIAAKGWYMGNHQVEP